MSVGRDDADDGALVFCALGSSHVALSAGVSADASYSGGVAVFTIAGGGLMYEASIGGQKFKIEDY